MRAINVLLVSSSTIIDLLADLLFILGFHLSWVHPDLQIKLSEYHDAYNYITEFVNDNFAIVQEPPHYLSIINYHSIFWNIEFVPNYYLPTQLKRPKIGKLQKSYFNKSKKDLGNTNKFF